jgi:hypothetical protein
LIANPNIFGLLFLLVVSHVFHRAYVRTGGSTGSTGGTGGTGGTGDIIDLITVNHLNHLNP